MNVLRSVVAIALLLGGMQAAPVRAAETLHSCTGFVDSLPASLSTAGKWCLRKDLSTTIGSGAAVTISADDATLDCNGYKIGGLAAGDASQAYGVYADGMQNATVRNCNIRGFRFGIYLSGGSDRSLVEDNRLDNILSLGIYIPGNKGIVRRNRIYDIGGYAAGGDVVGIASDDNGGGLDIIDNIISGVVATHPGNPGQASGIVARDRGVVSGNQVSMLVPGAGHTSIGIGITGKLTVIGNRVFSGGTSLGNYGILANGMAVCKGNLLGGFQAGFTGCTLAGGNWAQY